MGFVFDSSRLQRDPLDGVYRVVGGPERPRVGGEKSLGILCREVGPH